MDWGDVTIEGAGLAIVGTLVAGIIAALCSRRHIVAGTALGMALALFTLPFVAYLVARLTNHQATDTDLTPPTYIVVTALACAAFTLLGLVGGIIAERRYLRIHGSLDDAYHDADENYIDDPSLWLPWSENNKNNMSTPE